MHKTVYCSDLHGNEALYNRLFEFAVDEAASFIVIGGDISPHFRKDIAQGINCQREFIEGFLTDFNKKVIESGINLFLIMGNDDYKSNYPLLAKFNNLHNNPLDIGSKKIIGYSFVPPTPFLLKDWEKLDDGQSVPLTDPRLDIRTAPKEDGTIALDLQRIASMSEPKNTIYVMHSPPFCTLLDKTYSGLHVGSKAIKEFIKKERPPLSLHGHIHEGPKTGSWKDEIGGCVCVNPGSLATKLCLACFDADNVSDIRYEVI